jgi:hypothetical protein
MHRTSVKKSEDGVSSSDMIQAEKLGVCSRWIMAVVRALLKPEVGDS